MKSYYSNGKLLLTGEYVVLDGATALAVPTKFGQDLVVEEIQEPQLIWGSLTHTGECWFETIFELPKLRLVNATFNSGKEGSAEFIAETLQSILQEARKLNPEFLQSETGFVVKTNLTFPRDWGLGSSSTLINNVAQWAKVDAYTLLWNAFSGSGYDIANAQNDSPIRYRLEDSKPVVESVHFNPSFKDQLYFIHLNKKQNSREGIRRYKEKRGKVKGELNRISEISKEIVKVKKLADFEKLIEEHEQIISKIVKLKPIKEELFLDYFGAIKSLGAWGGDFILATGNENTPSYFKEKGYTTILSYSEMVL
ncbi:MAG: GHMP kinase [Flavobacteriaceae bacterium]